MKAGRGEQVVPSLRIDALLWYLRFAPSRSAAKKLAEKKIVRLNGRRVERGHSPVRIGDILTMPRGNDVYVIRIACLPPRRGSAIEAAQYYEPLQTDDCASK